MFLLLNKPVLCHNVLYWDCWLCCEFTVIFWLATLLVTKQAGVFI